MRNDLQQEIRMYDGMVFGHKVSGYGLENGYLDYQTLAKVVGDCILNNDIIPYTGYENWEQILGDECEEIFQYYIITENGYLMLEHFTDEVVFYNSELDMYVWGITHFGTSWDYVLTNLKLVEGCK